MLNRCKILLYPRIHLYCTKSIETYLKTLFTSVYKIVPKQLLSIFAPYQIQMLLNGPRHIDVRDWRANTIYQGGYNKDDQVVRWFWEQVEQSDQEGLRNLLHYCTGGVRVPILGFRYLESNRGEVKPFTIRKVEESKENPFPKSYTCFNRLQLPFYRDREQLRNNLKVVMGKQFNHFGLG